MSLLKATECFPSGRIVCSGHGTCVANACQCDIDSNGFGYCGDDCSTPCGSKVYQDPKIPGTDRLLAPEDMEADCFCRQVTGYNDTRMHAADMGKFRKAWAYAHPKVGMVPGTIVCWPILVAGLCYRNKRRPGKTRGSATYPRPETGTQVCLGTLL